MSELLNIFKSDHLTHVSNYSGVFDPGASYQKFDFIYNTGDGLFYYARDDMTQGGDVVVEGGYRFTLDPNGSTYNGSPTHYIYDESNDNQNFSVGQTLNISGSLNGSDGEYNILSIEEDYEVEVILPAENNLFSAIDAQSLGNGWHESSWFFKSNVGETNSIDVPMFYAPNENWIYSIFWGWVYVSLPNNNEKEFWFYSQIGGGMWFWASNQLLGSSNVELNSFIYLGESGDSTLGPNGWLEWFGVDPFQVNKDHVYYPFALDGGFTQATVYLGSQQDVNIVTSSWNDGSLSISQEQYSSLPEYTYWNYKTRIKWLILGKDAFVIGHKALIKNNSNNKFYGFTKNNSFEEIDDPSVVSNIPPTITLPDRVASPKKLKIEIQGISTSTVIKEYEVYSENLLSISTVDKDITNNPDNWSKDLFFFDADYGSTVNFRTNNQKYEYGNGYYVLQPKNINNLTMEASLKFKNRTNRETNAMIHFLENHQGQHEQYDNTANLRYNQGIAGFRWDGNAAFHPYDSTQVQSKKFTSSEWNHSLNFENSNDIDIKITNLDSSILQKNNGLFVYPAEEYSDSEYYEKNDVVYSSVNKSFYYWSGDASAAGKDPVEAQVNWAREHGYFKDTHTECWTRDFFWRPSIGLNVNQKPRLSRIALGAGYTQTFNDGINESLLMLDFNFNNRTDSEARAILHFLEQHYGCIPFNFTPPAPYDTSQNFVCQEWSHTYNYKNNHSISARFEQYPFNFSAQQYESSITPSPEAEGELVFTSPFVMKVKDVGEELSIDTNFRGRLLLRNIGDKSITLENAFLINKLNGQVSLGGDLRNRLEGIDTSFLRDLNVGDKIRANDEIFTINSIESNTLLILNESHPTGFRNTEIYSVSADSDGFYILGQQNDNVPLIKKNLHSSNREFFLPAQGSGVNLSNVDETISLYNKKIRIRNAFTGGIEGGYIFDVVEVGGQSFIQYNNGVIRDLSNKNITLETDYFINEEFIKNSGNTTNVLNGGEESYIEIVFKGVKRSNSYYNLLYMTEPVRNEQGSIITSSEEGGALLGDSLSDGSFNIIGAETSRYYSTSIVIDSDSLHGSKSGEVKIYINT